MCEKDILQNIPENKHRQFNSKAKDKQQKWFFFLKKHSKIRVKKQTQIQKNQPKKNILLPLHLPVPTPSKDKNNFTSGIIFQTPPAGREKQLPTWKPPIYACCPKE